MRKVFAVISLIFIPYICHADEPSRKGLREKSRRSLSDVNYSTYRSTPIPGGFSGRENVQMATGVIRLDGMMVCSTGTNSKMIWYDSNFLSAGNSTIQINAPGDNTDTQVWIPYHIETSTQGLVYTSTCNVCTNLWSAPNLRATIERIR